MLEGGDYIAIDWGTSNRRVFLVGADGSVRDAVRDALGATAIARGDHGGEVDRLRKFYGVDTVIAAGMVGSTRGWLDVPYMALPTVLDDLVAGLVQPQPGVYIVPGVSRTHGRCDVMRGEETLVLGAHEARLVPADALLCQPGTHNKWIELRDGRIVDFTTAMTGELFALLKAYGTLSDMLDAAVADGTGFRAGLARGRDARDLATALFEVRARVLLDDLSMADAASYASGILIGADVGARRDLPGREVHLIGTGPLSDLYATAIAAVGGRSSRVDAEVAFLAGAHAIRRSLP